MLRKSGLATVVVIPGAEQKEHGNYAWAEYFLQENTSRPEPLFVGNYLQVTCCFFGQYKEEKIHCMIRYITVQFFSAKICFNNPFIFIWKALCAVKSLFYLYYFIFCRKFKAEGIQIRINLAVALFLAQVVFLSGIDATNNKVWFLARKPTFQRPLCHLNKLKIIKPFIFFLK